ncbi:MAG TPA: shikimate kinase [Candidatus Binatia bacterium]|nr:shikimate kinase [Candidatus Binatia bacterium]
MARPIVLIGMMGCGKTTVGQALARRLSRPFWDSDAQLEAATGQTAARLGVDRGIDALHSLEVEVLARGLAHRPPRVVAAAAAVILDQRMPSLIGNAWVIWLRVDVARLATRLQRDDGHRPLPAGDLLGMLREMARTRDPLYARFADLSLEASRSSPAGLVRRILAEMPPGT